MTIDSDDMISLPSPPPPQPAARRDAIDAALRKFDGVEDRPGEKATRKPPSRISWATMHRRPAGALLTAALIAVVFIPAVPFILRDNPPNMDPQAEVPRQVQPAQDAFICAGADCAGHAASEPRQALPDEAVATAASPSPAQPLAPPAVVAEERREAVSAASDRKAALEAPAPVLAAPAPPPPPPPAPPEPEVEGGQNIVVTGSLIRAPNAAKQSLADEVGYAAKPANRSAMIDPYGDFLSRLQVGLKANDRRTIIGLIGFPLRVNLNGRTRAYRSPQDVERDYDLIFTPQVRSAVLNQRPADLMSRDGGRLKGNGKLWFGPSCSKKSCSREDPIRIKEVNP